MDVIPIHQSRIYIDPYIRKGISYSAATEMSPLRRLLRASEQPFPMLILRKGIIFDDNPIAA